MKHLLLGLLVSFSLLHAQKIDEPISPAFMKKHITVFDIRTKAEWKETGILKNSIPLTFFDEKGRYDVNAFVREMKRHLKKGETFALICHTGSRSNMVTSFLGKNGFTVINLQGGIAYAQKQKMPLVPYTAK